ncbi:MAG: hypothetical protein Fur0041_18820 [Bacteroidia bacterium]
MIRSLNILLFVLFAFTLISCEKEEITSGPASDIIHVTYKVTAQSGASTVSYLAPVNGVTQTTTIDYNRVVFEHSFDWTKGQNLRVEAHNTIPSNKEVIAEIYVNGVLFKQSIVAAPGAHAIAEGKY